MLAEEEHLKEDRFKHDEYHPYKVDFKVRLETQLKSPNRFQSILERKHEGIHSAEEIRALCTGRYLSTYKGVPLLKGPQEMFIFHQLLWHEKPGTIIELGAFTGANALMMADTANTLGIECQVYSVDIDLSLLDDIVKKHQPDNLKFLYCDCTAIDKTFTPDFIANIAHPLVVIDDVHVNTSGNLDHFHQFLKSGDYIIVEDTNPRIPDRMTYYDDNSEYHLLGTRKLDDLEEFLKKHNSDYAVDSFYCDFYGYNCTFNWNGWTRRMT